VTRSPCPPWCDLDPLDGHLRHRGATAVVPVTLETGGAHAGELVVELARDRDSLAVWLYLGDGWTGFSLSMPSAARLGVALESALRAAGTLDRSGL
jgi:hypothetical protein